MEKNIIIQIFNSHVVISASLTSEIDFQEL